MREGGRLLIFKKESHPTALLRPPRLLILVKLSVMHGKWDHGFYTVCVSRREKSLKIICLATYLIRHLFLLVNIKISEHKLRLSPLFHVLTPSLKQLPQSVLNTTGGTLINFQKKFPPLRLITPHAYYFSNNFPTPQLLRPPLVLSTREYFVWPPQLLNDRVMPHPTPNQPTYQETQHVIM